MGRLGSWGRLHAKQLNAIVAKHRAGTVGKETQFLLIDSPHVASTMSAGEMMGKAKSIGDREDGCR